MTLLYLLTGLAAGFVGGLLGLGGGIVLVPVLRFGVGLSPAMTAGTTVVAVFFTTFGGALRHYRSWHIDWQALAPVIGAGAAATFFFSLLFPAFAREPGWLDLGIGLVFSLVAIRMIVESAVSSRTVAVAEAAPAGRGQGPGKLAIGIGAGVLPGLLGIGAGTVLVPGFRLLLRWPIKVAMGSSLACFAASALVSAVLKGIQGYVDLPVALPASLGAFLGAGMGAAVNRRFPSRFLQRLFGLVFIYVSMKFMLTSFGIHI